MNEERKLVHVERMPIRWGDMDAMGHVNNTLYFRYMEQARISWFDTLGAHPGPDSVGPIIVNAACTFKKNTGPCACRSACATSCRSEFMEIHRK